MLENAEENLISAIAPFGVVGAVIDSFNLGIRNKNRIDIEASQVLSGILPGQCQAFLTTSREFVWFVEQWDVTPKPGDQTSFDIPLVSLQNKKVYPAKVKGLSLALLGLSDTPIPVTVRWREGLIRYGSYYPSQYYDALVPCLRPGFGQQIIDDLKRPMLSETVTTNHLGLIGATANSYNFSGTLGRLISAAFHVDETLAKLYDASLSKKKKKSLNSQDYEQIPTYPTYNTYVNTGY